jgi:hypothetical protein
MRIKLDEGIGVAGGEDQINPAPIRGETPPRLFSTKGERTEHRSPLFRVPRLSSGFGRAEWAAQKFLNFKRIWKGVRPWPGRPVTGS